MLVVIPGLTVMEQVTLHGPDSSLSMSHFVRYIRLASICHC